MRSWDPVSKDSKIWGGSSWHISHVNTYRIWKQQNHRKVKFIIQDMQFVIYFLPIKLMYCIISSFMYYFLDTYLVSIRGKLPQNCYCLKVYISYRLVSTFITGNPLLLLFMLLLPFLSSLRLFCQSFLRMIWCGITCL